MSQTVKKGGVSGKEKKKLMDEKRKTLERFCKKEKPSKGISRTLSKYWREKKNWQSGQYQYLKSPRRKIEIL